MNKLNQWLTLLANIGVALGIVFLVVQIRQNNTLMKATAFQDRSSDLIQIAAMVAESEALANALAKLDLPNSICDAQAAPLDTLSDAELTLFKQYLMAQIFRLQNLQEQYRHGLIRPEHHKASVRAVARYLPWMERLQLPEAAIGRRILGTVEEPVDDPYCSTRAEHPVR